MLWSARGATKANKDRNALDPRMQAGPIGNKRNYNTNNSDNNDDNNYDMNNDDTELQPSKSGTGVQPIMGPGAYGPTHDLQSTKPGAG